MRDVEHQGAGSVGHVDGALSGQTEADVILGKHYGTNALPILRFVFLDPHEFGKGEVGECRITGKLSESRGANSLGSVPDTAVRCARRTRSGQDEPLPLRRRA